MTTRAKQIYFTMDDRGYEELEHIGKALGLTVHQTGRLGTYMWILSIKHQAVKLYLSDETRLEKDAIETLQMLSGQKIERVK